MISHRPLVLLDGRACAGLVGPLRAALRDADQRGHQVDDATRKAIGEIEELADTWIATAGTGSAALPHVTDRDAPEMVDAQTTQEVADMLGTKARNVRDLAQRQVLPGQRTKAGWQFDPADVAIYLEDRREPA